MNINRKVGSSEYKKKQNDTIKILLDIKTLDFYCRYIVSENKNIKASSLNLVKSLFNKVDPSLYNGDLERINRIEFIKRGLEARSVKKLTDRDLIIQYINGGPLDKPLLEGAENYKEISDEELAYLNEQTNELTKSYFVDDKYEQILSLSTDLKNANYTRRSDVVHQIQELTSELNAEFKRMDTSITRSSDISSLEPDIWKPYFTDLYARENNPSRMLKSGMVGLNRMLDGGFYGGRVYMFFGTAAAGKSMTLLDLALQIKRYNKDYITHDPTKRPCIVFLTMENSTDENNTRIFSMVSSNARLSDYDFEEADQIYAEGGYAITDDDPIDIVMVYKANLSIDTDYLYTIMDDMNDMGKEPICIIQDHIKRIRPVNRHNNDLRLELGEIVNEFKAFANETGIPLITVSHLNREAAKTIDTASIKNGKDLTRSLGSFNVSESYLMIDNCDFGIIINKENDSHGLTYMGFNQIKSRTKCDLDIFFQPYVLCENDRPIKLVEDVNAIKPAYLTTLMDGDQVSKMKAKSNDYRKNIRKVDDDDNYFSSEVMGGATSESTDDILLPFNENQSMFNVVGGPSQPVFNNIIQMPVQSDPIMMESVRVPTEWENELVSLKYNSVGRTAIAFLDSSGLVINDGVEDLA